MSSNKHVVKPGLFSRTSHADVRRNEFDLKNEMIVKNGINVDCVFIGDSITSRWEVEVFFKHRGCVVNRGIAGDNSEYLKFRLEADAIQLNPKAIVLWIGVNDTMFIGTDYINIDKSPNSLKNRIVCNTIEMITKVIDSGISLKVCSILPINIKGDGFNDVRNRIIRDANYLIKNYCTDREVDYIDMYTELLDLDNLTLKDGYTSDGVHLDNIGYNYAFSKIDKFLE